MESVAKGAMEGGNHAALWHGRFEEGPDAQAVEFETSIYVDQRMAQDDITGSKAHVAMLGASGIIPQTQHKVVPIFCKKVKKLAFSIIYRVITFCAFRRINKPRQRCIQRAFITIITPKCN